MPWKRCNISLCLPTFPPHIYNKIIWSSLRSFMPIGDDLCIFLQNFKVFSWLQVDYSTCFVCNTFKLHLIHKPRFTVCESPRLSGEITTTTTDDRVTFSNHTLFFLPTTYQFQYQFWDEKSDHQKMLNIYIFLTLPFHAYINFLYKSKIN